MPVLTDTAIAAAAKVAGFTGEDLIIAVAVALAESGGDPAAVSRTHDYGLWQIHAAAWPDLMTPGVMAAGTWKTPTVNAAFAHHIWRWGGWRPWSTYTSGSYQRYMARAQAAVTGGETMPTKADLVLEYWRLIRGFPYRLGWESSPDGPDARYDVGEPLNPSEPGDCSGDVWASWIYAGICRDGAPITKADRHTAHTYWTWAKIKLAQPSQPGDLGFHVDGADHAYHVFEYLDLLDVGEMGDGTGHAAIHTVAYENAKGCKWARIPGMDFGQLSGTTPPVPGYVDWPELLKNPCDGPHVKVLKVWLNHVMGSHLDVTNPHFRDETEKWVRAFQLKYMGKAEVDGEVGNRTQAALYKAFTAL